MADWKRLTEAGLESRLSRAEMDAYRRSARDGSDPVPALLAQEAALCRAHLRTGGRCRLSPDPLAVPPSLEGACYDIAAYDALKRMPCDIGQDRRLARGDALNLLARCSDGTFSPEGWDGDGGEDGQRAVPAATDPDAGARLGG